MQFYGNVWGLSAWRVGDGGHVINMGSTVPGGELTRGRPIYKIFSEGIRWVGCCWWCGEPLQFLMIEILFFTFIVLGLIGYGM